MYERHMRQAVQKAKNNQSSFGAVLAMGDQVLVSAADADPGEHDPVGHAILVALRGLGALTHETQFPGYDLYTTVEPCPLCASACLITQLQTVYFGIGLDEVAPSRYPGQTRARDIFSAAEQSPELKGGILESECRNLL